MPVKLDERIYRAMITPMQAVPTGAQKRIDSAYYVEGYAATVNQPYTLCGDYQEQIAPGVLLGADISDVIMQYDHEGKVLARVSNGSLIVEEDAHGVFVAADLSRSKAARDLYEEIQAALVIRMSWGFTPAPDADAFDAESKLWTISRVKKVYDVSAVSLAANDATKISARSRVEGAIDSERREALARKTRALQLLTRL